MWRVFARQTFFFFRPWQFDRSISLTRQGLPEKRHGSISWSGTMLLPCRSPTASGHARINRPVLNWLTERGKITEKTWGGGWRFKEGRTIVCSRKLVRAIYWLRARRAGECYTLKNFWCKKKKLNNDRQKRDSEKTARLQASGCNVNVKVVEHQDNNELDQKREGKQRKSLLTRNYSKHRRGAFLLHTAEENDLEWRDDWRKIDNRLCAEWGASSNMKDRHNEELVNCKFVELSSNQRIDVKRTKGVWEEKSFWNNKCNLIVGAPRRGRCSGSKFSDILATGPSRSMLTFEWRGVC